MQFDAEVYPYQRIKKVKREDHNKSELNLHKVVYGVSYFMAALLISRVIMINLMAPFGLAFLLAVTIREDNRISVISGCGVLLGYISLNGNLNNLPAYIIAVGAVTGLGCALRNKGRLLRLSTALITVLVLMCLYNMLIQHIDSYMCIINSLFETASIFPLYYIMDNSLLCIKQINTRHLYKSEEIMSMAVLLSLTIAGTWGISINNISLRNVIALTFILIIGYVKGSTSGAACGVAAGMIIGITSSSMTAYVGFFGLCGMLGGIFKEGGKWISGISFMLAFAIIKMYSNMGTELTILECIISCIIFFLIPGRFLSRAELELDWERKQDLLQDNYTVRIKELLLKKLDNFSDVLLNMSNVLGKLVDNDKLAMKGKSCALIETLGDRVCSSCNMKSMCWKREYYQTYSAFAEMIESFQENKCSIPEEIERKCVKRTALINNAQDIINNFIMNEMWNKRLSENREILAGQINNIAKSISEIAENFDCDINFNNVVENNIRRVLNKNDIKFRDILSYNNKNGRLIIKLDMDHCGGRQLCIKSILPLINEVTEKCMCVSQEGCSLNHGENTCSLTLEETPKYHIAACVKSCCKDGEKYSGDSYLNSRLDDGSFMTILSDGMGSGPDAKRESSAAVELLHKFSKSGFSKFTAINIVNSMLSIKFSENEKFSTVDISNVDLYTGEVDFIKVGAASSFIKTSREVIPVKSRTLPMGVLDSVDIDVNKKKIKNGDFIVMLSDGVVDYDSSAPGKDEWIEEFLNNKNYTSPEELCSAILSKAKELSGGKVRDDMTVIVEKVYSLY